MDGAAAFAVDLDGDAFWVVAHQLADDGFFAQDFGLDGDRLTQTLA